MTDKVYNPVYPGLYYFDTFTFTTLGTTGHRGPEPLQMYANAPWRDGDFSIVDGQQQWTVPANGTYQITAAGAYGAAPGRVVTGQVDLYEGQIISLLVGQQPIPLTPTVLDNLTVGGGGGTFVVSNGKPLMVASGGDGGVSSTGYTGDFLPSGDGSGQSGAGYLTNGTQPSDPFFQFLTPIAYVNGGFGNVYNYGTPDVPEEGGFGGGQCPLGLLTQIATIDGDGSTVYVTTTVPHGYPFNYVIVITDTTFFNGVWSIQVTGSDSFAFTYDIVGSETYGFVSGITTGISGGGGYTGSPGDGVSGATCYADPSVVNFTDLGATSNSSGCVTVSLIDPVPDKKISDAYVLGVTQTIDVKNIYLTNLIYSPQLNIFIACGGLGQRIIYSTDGKTWKGTNYIGTSVRSAAWSPDLGIFVSPSISEGWYSVDGMEWISKPATIPNAFSDIIWVPFLNSFIGLSYQLYQSYDGIIWTIIETAPPYLFVGNGAQAWDSPQKMAASSNAVVIADRTKVYISTNGIDWNESSYIDGDTDITKVLYENGIFFIAATTKYYISYDNGNTWSRGILNFTSDASYQSAVFLDKTIVVTSPTEVLISTDYINWVLHPNNTNAQLKTTIYQNRDKYIVSISLYNVYLSIDGTLWAPVENNYLAGYYSDLSCSPTNNTILATCNPLTSIGPTGIYSQDGGINWKEIPGLDFYPSVCIYDPLRGLFKLSDTVFFNPYTVELVQTTSREWLSLLTHTELLQWYYYSGLNNNLSRVKSFSTTGVIVEIIPEDIFSPNVSCNGTFFIKIPQSSYPDPSFVGEKSTDGINWVQYPVNFSATGYDQYLYYIDRIIYISKYASFFALISITVSMESFTTIIFKSSDGENWDILVNMQAITNSSLNNMVWDQENNTIQVFSFSNNIVTVSLRDSQF